MSEKLKEENAKAKNAPESSSSGTAKKGSLAEKANMVKDYNERHQKK